MQRTLLTMKFVFLLRQVLLEKGFDPVQDLDARAWLTSGREDRALRVCLMASS